MHYGPQSSRTVSHAEVSWVERVLCPLLQLWIQEKYRQHAMVGSARKQFTFLRKFF